ALAGVTLLFSIEARLKRLLKPLLFRDEVAPRRVRFGIGRGLVLLLNRRHELQKELGLWEIEAQPIYKRWVTRGSTVFDIGASGGDSALLLARLAAPGTVVAFEPDPALRRRLPQNAALNPGLPPLFILPWFAGARDDDGGTVTLDSIVARGTVPPPQFIKVDVDGAELDVLAGAQQVLASHRPILFVEVHGIDRERDCVAFLHSRGYEVRIVKNAWWRALYPEHRPIGHNRWLLAVPSGKA
ncbi:MAG TPA: FkbM family methyltransferase, partial [bacterium]|nr:FkbM family methyltransferase [bacterium]